MRNFSVANFFKWAVIVIFVIFIAAQFYSSIIAPFSTENVMAYSFDDGFETTGIVLRNETLIKSESSGTLAFRVDQGERVAKGGTIADIYADSSAADANRRLAEINEQIAALQKSQSYNSFNASDLDLLNDTISNNLISLLKATQNGYMGDAGDAAASLADNMNRKHIVLGDESDYSAVIASLTSEKQSLEAGAAKTVGSVVSPISGYFIAGIDGYENAADLSDLSEFDADKINSLEPSAENGDYIGKVVSDYKWYIAATLPLDKAISMEEGKTYKINTALSSAASMSAKLEKINRGESGDAAVIFSCENMNSELAGVRKMSFKIVSKSYSGLRVNSKAIRMKDGKKGVYVLVGQEVRFREVKVIYAGNSFSICEKQTEGKNRLKLYDEAIVKGKNLYDGKSVD